ncbi:MAG: hypothetical protein ABIO70_11385 [Pseudomonadota bacterium]
MQRVAWILQRATGRTRPKIAASNTADYTISAAFTTRTQFGRFIKVQLGLVDDGASYTARFSMWLEVKLWT